MNSLVSIGLTNAVLATLLAVAAWAVMRFWRQPALSHLLWAVVLLKLLTPTLVEIPVGWKLDLAFAHAPPPASPSLVRDDSQQPAVSEAAPPTNPQAVADIRNFGEGVKTGNPEPTRPAPKYTGSSAVGKTTSDAGPARAASRQSSFACGVQATGIALATWLPAIWLCGVAGSFFIVVRRVWAFHAFLRRAGSVDPSLSRRVQQLAREAGLASAPDVVVVHSVVSPMLWGAGRRIQLIFPARLAQELSPLARDTLLLHELAHFSRGDQWVRLLELAAHVLFWWHPVVWWARHEIEAAEEQCCDAWVVERQSGSRRVYAEALLATIDFLCEQAVLLPPAASGLGDVPLLRFRLTQIMQGELAASLSARARIGVLIVAAFILPLGPALLGSSVQPRPLSPSATIVRQPPATAAEPTTAAETARSFDESTSGVPATTAAATAANASLPAVIRPAAVVTASAVSRNGKYRLERRKGSHVTLVNQIADWRLDLSTHAILCVAFTPDSRLFVTGHEDSIVRIWDSDTGGLVANLKGCTDSVWSVAVTMSGADEYRVAAGAKDGSVLVWDLASREELSRLPPAGVSVSCLRWSERGDKLAISYGDFSDQDHIGLLVWSPLKNLPLWRATLDRPAAAVAWLPGDSSLLVADWKGEAQIWQPGDESPQSSIWLEKDGKQTVEAAHWSVDCPLIPSSLAKDLFARAN